MSRTYELALQIAGKLDGSLAKSTEEAGKKLGGLEGKIAALQKAAAKTEQFAALEERLRFSSANYSKLQGAVNELSGEHKKAERNTQSLGERLAETQRSVEKYKTSLTENRFALKEASSEVKRLKAAIKSTDQPTDEMRQNLAAATEKAARLKQAIDADSLALHRAKSAIKPLNTEFKIAKQVSDDYARRLQAARVKVGEFQRATEREKTTLTALKNEMKFAGGATEEFRAKQAKLQAQIERSEKALRQYKKIQGMRDKMSGMQGTASNVMMKGAAATATMAVPAYQAMSMESSMADVKKVVDAPDEYFDGMEKDIVNLSRRIPMLATDLAKITASGGQSGIAKEDLIAFTEDSAKMGVAFDVSADQAGEMMAKWRTAFKMSQSEVVDLADKINHLGNNTAASAPKISDVVRRIGPLGEVGGVASGEIAALGASMVGTGVESEVAATGIKNLILGLVAGEGATKSQAEGFAQLGLDATEMAKRMQTDAKGAIVDVLTRVQSLDKYQQASVLKSLFGSESLSAISPLLANLDNLKKNLALVGDKSAYAGSMQKEFESRISTTEAQLQLARNAASAASMQIGKILIPWIKKGADAFSGIANTVEEFSNKYPALTEALVLFGGGTAIAVTGAAALAYAIMGIGGPILTAYSYMQKWQFATKAHTLATKGLALATKGLAIAQKGLNLVMNMSPIARVAMLVLGLAGVAKYLYDNCDTLREKWTAVWENFKSSHPVIAGVLEGIFNALSAPYRMICNLVDKVKEMIGLEPSVSFKYTELEGAYKRGKREDFADENFYYDADGNIQHLASGGIFPKGEFLTTFAEEGPEAAIPLDGSPRSVAIWQQAGQMLGVLDDAPEGGRAKPKPGGRESRNPTNAFAPKIAELPEPQSIHIDTGAPQEKPQPTVVALSAQPEARKDERTEPLVINGGPVTINLTVNGEAKPKEIEKAVQNGYEQGARSFADEMKAFMNQRRRVSYA